MRTLNALKREASKSARFRGHRLSWRNVYGRADGPKSQSATCRKCGAGLTVEQSPAPNGIEIGGPAVAVNCGKSVHTPGPWKVNHRQHGCVYIGSDSMPVAMTSRSMFKGNESEAMIEADARLIAAAPRLLAALSSLVEAVNQKELDPFVVFAAIEYARATIESAGGV